MDIKTMVERVKSLIDKTADTAKMSKTYDVNEVNSILRRIDLFAYEVNEFLNAVNTDTKARNIDDGAVLGRTILNEDGTFTAVIADDWLEEYFCTINSAELEGIFKRLKAGEKACDIIRALTGE
jgi:hypothetical protein